jgi:putative spermidine/putrescine transport system permease protein
VTGPLARRPAENSRPTAAVLLAPVLVVVVGLFGGGLALAVAQSLGISPLAGPGGLTARHYGSALTEPGVLGSALTSGWIAAASTAVALVLGASAAIALHRLRAVRAGVGLLQAALPVPHLVGAITFGLLLADSGLVSRLGAAAGLLDRPADFPALVDDPWAIGVITTYAWKEVPFVAIVALAALSGGADRFHHVAATLGAGRGARLRHVTLPLLAPALLAAGVLVFAFTFGAYEVPALLGRSYPEALPVLSYRLFSSVELDARPSGLAVAVLISVVGAVAAVGYAVATRRMTTRGGW